MFTSTMRIMDLFKLYLAKLGLVLGSRQFLLLCQLPKKMTLFIALPVQICSFIALFSLMMCSIISDEFEFGSFWIRLNLFLPNYSVYEFDRIWYWNSDSFKFVDRIWTKLEIKNSFWLKTWINSVISPNFGLKPCFV